MIKHRCTECGGPLPSEWTPVATRTCVSLCPACAAKEMRIKSERRKKVAQQHSKHAVSS
jgi:hypothetical protein